MNVLGIVPARGGSRTIPRKNLVEVGGRPLLAWTAEAARGSATLSRIVLTTDDEDIAAAGRRLGLEVPFLRPAALATDDAAMVPVLRHVLDVLRERERYMPDAVALLQPTSPLRTAAHIDRAVRLLADTGADSVVSVVEVPHQFSPMSVLRLDGDRLRPFAGGATLSRRQDKPVLYARNGPAVLVARTRVVVEQDSLYGDDSRALVMTAEESVDIDGPWDLELADWLLRRREMRVS